MQLDGTVMRALAGGWPQLVASVADGETGTDLRWCRCWPTSTRTCCDAGRRVDLIRAWERVRAMVDGLQQRALCAVVDATEGRGLAEEQARHEVGAALRLSPPTAGERTWVATALGRRLPGHLAALEAGRHLLSAGRAPGRRAVRELDRRRRQPPWRPGCWAGRRSRPSPSSGAPWRGR